MVSTARRRTLPAFVAGLAVLVLGFGALNALYFAIGTELPGPGLYGYLSSSFGDALLLPLLVFFLVRASLAIPAALSDLLPWLAGTAVGALGGLALQWSWLADPDPTLNWTLVAAGTFNIAGWYHAIFLCLIAALITGLTVRLGWRLKGRNTWPGVGLDLVGVAATALAFGVLLLLDNVWRIGIGSGGTLIASGAGLMLLIGLAGVLLARSLRIGRKEEVQRGPAETQQE